MITLEKIKKIVAEKFLVDENMVTETISFVEDLGLDDLDFTELVWELEREFDIVIPDDIIEKLETVGDVVDYIKLGKIFDKTNKKVRRNVTEKSDVNETKVTENSSFVGSGADDFEDDEDDKVIDSVEKELKTDIKPRQKKAKTKHIKPSKNAVFYSVRELYERYVFDHDVSFWDIKRKLYEFYRVRPDAVEYNEYRDYIKLNIKYLKKFLKFTGWKILKDSEQPELNPDLPWYQEDKSFKTLSDEELDSFITGLVDAGIDGFNKAEAEDLLINYEKLSMKTGQWMSAAELCKYFEAGVPTIYKWMQELRYKLFNVIKERDYGAKVALYLHKDAIDLFAQESGLRFRGQMPEKTSEWLVAPEVMARLGLSEAVVRRMMKDLQPQMPDVIMEVKSRSVHALALHESGLERFAAEVERLKAQLRSDKGSEFLRGAGLVRMRIKLRKEELEMTKD